jgi:hypothetical protein
MAGYAVYMTGDLEEAKNGLIGVLRGLRAKISQKRKEDPPSEENIPLWLFTELITFVGEINLLNASTANRCSMTTNVLRRMADRIRIQFVETEGEVSLEEYNVVCDKDQALIQLLRKETCETAVFHVALESRYNTAMKEVHNA